MNFDTMIQALTRIVGEDGVIVDAGRKLVYEYDASFDTHPPDVVVLPQTTEQVSAIATLAAQYGVPLVARGAGTGLSGGALATQGGILLVLTRMRTIQSVDARNRRAMAEAGVVNQHLVDAAGQAGLTYAPDPGSGRTSTIGGNIASNAGGPHCLAYGVTVNHVTGVKAVLYDGTVIEAGSPLADAMGYDLTGVLVGSEGTLGVVTEATLQLMAQAESVRTTLVVFQSIEEASAAVSAVIAAGIVPTAMEMMDGKVCRAVEAAVQAGYPEDAGAVLLIEVEGLADGLHETMATIETICRDHNADQVHHATTGAERARLWLGRKSALGAMGRIAPSYFLEDGVVPRHRLPEIMAFIEEVARKYDLPIGNFFHAGDGNIHPTILFDRRDSAVLARARKAATDILEKCIEVGGTVSGEHGVGTEKQDYLSLLYTQDDLDAMYDLKTAFDPTGRLNPGKIFPRSYRPSRRHRAGGPERNDNGLEASNGNAGAPSADIIAARLEAIVGSAHVNAPADEPGCSVGDQAPRLTVAPASVEESAAVLAVAHELGLAVAPVGGNTRRLLGNPLTRCDLAVSTRRLDRINAHYPSDLTLSVQAGRTLTATNRTLAESGQMLPLDAPLADRATLGGILAAGPLATGLRRLGYGTIRDMVTGIQVVRPDGRIFRRGGMVVKNVAGYDMSRLQYGAMGTLGLIAEINLKLLPLPQASAAVLAGFHQVAAADAVAARLLASRLQPVTVAMLDGATAAAAGLVEEREAAIWLLVRFDGREEAVIRQVKELTAWAQADGARACRMLDALQLAERWPALTDLTQLAAGADNEALFRLTLQPSAFESAWTRTADDCHNLGLSPRQFGDAANGILWLRVANPAPDSAARVTELYGTWLAAWPQTVIAAASPALKRNVLAAGETVWGRQPHAIELMRAVKRQFDPHNMLNPGRYLVDGEVMSALPGATIVHGAYQNGRILSHVH